MEQKMIQHEQKTVQHGVEYSSALGAIQFRMGSIIHFSIGHNTVRHVQNTVQHGTEYKSRYGSARGAIQFSIGCNTVQHGEH
jgi:hypothetical protein